MKKSEVIVLLITGIVLADIFIILDTANGGEAYDNGKTIIPVKAYPPAPSNSSYTLYFSESIIIYNKHTNLFGEWVYDCTKKPLTINEITNSGKTITISTGEGKYFPYYINITSHPETITINNETYTLHFITLGNPLEIAAEIIIVDGIIFIIITSLATILIRKKEKAKSI